MADYAYSALNDHGQHVNGQVTATSRDQAIKSLREQKLRPLTVKEAQANGLAKMSLGKKKVKSKELVIFTRELSTMVSAGVSLPKTLDTLATQSENKYFKQVISGITHDVESGATLADAMAKSPHVFNDVYVNMVRAGEAGGILDEILKKLAQQQEKDAAIKAKVKSATTYPMVLLAITVIAFFVLTIFVVPKIGDLVLNLGGPNAKLPPQTQAMMAVSKFIRHQWYLVAALLIGGPIFLNRWRKTPKGKRKFDAFILKVPVMKTIATKVAIARFARTFSSLMGAGVTVLESLEVTAHALGNYEIEQELLRSAKEVKEGKQLSAVLGKSKLFPPIVSQMLSVGEETGKTDTVLVKVAEFYEEEVDAVVDSLSSILEPIMIVVMGSMVGLIAASVIGPITSLNQSIGG
jgi:type IV pilus assembly protein PilC